MDMQTVGSFIAKQRSDSIGRACLPHLPRHYRSQDQPQLHDQVINGGSALKIKHADISSRCYHAFRFLYYKYLSSSNSLSIISLANCCRQGCTSQS
ncbi:hypothetical protein J6590_055196 [Homalodisca vitripennis]|nr:hypothetical protein J6590_055196 [Homalodisca vitripennis]